MVGCPPTPGHATNIHCHEGGCCISSQVSNTSFDTKGFSCRLRYKNHSFFRALSRLLDNKRNKIFFLQIKSLRISDNISALFRFLFSANPKHPKKYVGFGFILYSLFSLFFVLLILYHPRLRCSYHKGYIETPDIKKHRLRTTLVGSSYRFHPRFIG